MAENSGGAHCLKYGFTTTHVLALDVVLPSGELVQLGSPALDAPGYDLAGVFVGSEGTLGVATKITLRIVKRPEVVQTLLAAFDSIQAAGQTVSDIIAARHVAFGDGDHGRAVDPGRGSRGPCALSRSARVCCWWNWTGRAVRWKR